MKIVFLGTAAATSCPLAFCNCDACVAGRKNGGKDLRKRASVVIDDVLLIDMGPDMMSASFEVGLDTGALKYLLQTHSHSDHFDAGHFITRMADYATQNIMPMKVVCSEKCAEHMSEKLDKEEGGATLMTPEWREKLAVELTCVQHGDVIRLGDYEITAVESAHDVNDQSLMYIIKKDGRAFIYATDTPLFTEKAWELIENSDIDVMAIDQTYGPGTPGGGHMHADQVAEVVKRLPGTKVYATHISHEGTPPHAELEKWTRARGYEVAYDGLTIEV